MKAKQWVLVKHFEGEPKEEDLELQEFDLSDELNEGGMFKKNSTFKFLFNF